MARFSLSFGCAIGGRPNPQWAARGPACPPPPALASPPAAKRSSKHRGISQAARLVRCGLQLSGVIRKKHLVLRAPSEFPFPAPRIYIRNASCCVRAARSR